MSSLTRKSLMALHVGARWPACWRSANKRCQSSGNQKRNEASAASLTLAWLEMAWGNRRELMAWTALKAWMLPRRGFVTEKGWLAWAAPGAAGTCFRGCRWKA